MDNIFKGCRTAEQGKTLYRKLSKLYHPDAPTGSTEKMQELNRQFEKFWSEFKDVHFNSETGETFTSQKKTSETARDFIDIITALSNLGVDIEICGTWLWISGNTYPVKSDLLKLGCKWASGKKKWFWTKEQTVYHKSRNSMNDIRAKYGSELIDTDSYKRMTIGAGK